MVKTSLDFEQLLTILTCPMHSSNLVVLNKNDLECSICDTVIGVVICKSPIKIDYLNNFVSGLLKVSTTSETASKKLTNWKTENLNFLLDMRIKPGIIADIGSGSGVFHTFLSLSQVIYIDFTNFRVTNLITDLNNDIPLDKESVDSIIMTNILEHLQDTKVIKESFRILKKGGNLYITVPFLLDVHQIPYDYHRYTYLYLTILLQREGFKIEVLKPSGDFGTFQTLVEHYYRFLIDKGSLNTKLLWQFQKIINFLLRKFVAVNFRKDFTGGYMIHARKTTQ